jgi:hypothetical protein
MGMQMTNFTRVGRRLRRRRVFAFLVSLVGLVILGGGLANHLDHGPPSRWVADPNSDPGWRTTIQVPIPPSDPMYQEIMDRRWRELLFYYLWAGGFLGVGAFVYSLSRVAPTKDVLLLAEAKKGLVTLPEVSTALDIDPRLASRALKQLQKLGIANPCWQEYRKNLWEFPDYVNLPLDRALEIAKKSGRVTLKDLVAQGHSVDTAQRTLDALSREGLAAEPPPNEPAGAAAVAQ